MQRRGICVVARSESVVTRLVAASGGWYDFTVRVAGQADLGRRFAGRMKTGADSCTDWAMHGKAIGDQYAVVWAEGRARSRVSGRGQ